MSESRLVPSNLMAWPSVSDLMPFEKLVLYHLWATAGSDCGCWLLDKRAFAAGILPPGADFSELHQALQGLKKRGLIVEDMETGEVFLPQWFRWHKFQTGQRLRLLKSSASKVSSPSLRETVRSQSNGMICENKEKSDGYVANESKVNEIKVAEADNALSIQDECPATPAASKFSDRLTPPQVKIRWQRGSGIVTYYPQDQEKAEFLESTISPMDLSNAVSRLIKRKKEPVPGLVQQELHHMLAKKSAKERQQQVSLPPKSDALVGDIVKIRTADALGILKGRISGEMSNSPPKAADSA